MKASRLLPVCLGLALAVVLVATPSQGGILTNFTGNTAPDNNLAGSTTDGHINFAVYDSTTGGAVGDTWGTGFAGFDGTFVAGVFSGGLNTSARYLYLYQTVNDGPHTGALDANGVAGQTGAITSWGTFDGLGFTQAASLTAAGGPYLGGASAPFGDPSPPLVDGTLAGIALNGAAVDPSFVARNTGTTAFFIFANLLPGQVSSLWGYTSNVAPQFGTAYIGGGGFAAHGTVPVTIAVPEPSTLLLSLFGALGLGLSWWRRRQ